MDKRAEAIAELERRLGHVFADRALVDRALTHASVGSGARKVPHNERLEFLGDRVLGLLAAETLVARHPDWREGELTRRHASLVAGKTCAEVARRIGLQTALRLAGSASKQGGRDNDRILGDAMEALMAAVYLDGGLQAARAVFAEAWTDALVSATAEQGREPKTALQEWAMAAGRPLPAYREVSRSGPDHAPLFVVEAEVQGHAPERAVGPSLRDAEKAAARALLEREGVLLSRAGFAAVIGAPNAGKSTLVNRLVGSKVTIVTQKAQTTRFPVRGVVIEGEAQIVLVDTPGIFRPRRRLDRAMVRAAWAGAHDADAVVHLVDAEAELAAAGPSAKAADRRAAEDVRTVIAGLKAAGRQAILAINKIDRVRREDLLALTGRLFDSGAYSEVFMISALDGSGVADLRGRLAELMPEGPWLYPEDQAADLPARLLAAEITREKVYLRVHEELPYAASVETTAFEERKDGSARIEQTIYVERDGQRAILIGKGGQTLKWIGEAARKELAEILGRPVHLFLTVKVKHNWAEARETYRYLGLDFDV